MRRGREVSGNNCPRQSVCYFENDARGNSWLARPPGIRSSTWILMLQMRTDTFPTRCALASSNGWLAKDCYLYTFPNEFPNIRPPERLSSDEVHARHNRTVHLLQKKCSEMGWRTCLEPTFTTDSVSFYVHLSF